MNEDDISRYLAKMLKGHGDYGSEAFAVVGRLIRLTLEYRDRWKAEKGEILTVEDTRWALEIYEHVLKSGHIPDELDDKIAGLVKLWIKNITGQIF